MSSMFHLFSELLPARVVLYILSFSGFLVSFMMRTDMNIAMVAMAKSKSSDSPQNQSGNFSATAKLSYCYMSDNESTEVYKVRI